MTKSKLCNSREEWAAAAVRVAKRQGYVRVNHYSTHPKCRFMARAVKHACALGMMKYEKGPRNERFYTLVESGGTP